MLRLLFLLVFAALALGPARLHAAPLLKDCLSAGSGAWQDPATWSGCDGAIPQAADNVYLQAGHTVALAADAAVADLHLNIGTDSGTFGNGAGLALGSYVLDVHGKLRSYSGLNGVVPGVNGARVRPDAITITAGSRGRLRVVGPSRTLTAGGEWGVDSAAAASPATFAVEVAADPQAIVRIETDVSASSWSITSGALQAVQSLLANPGAVDSGDITIGPQGTLISAAYGSAPVVARTKTARGGTFTVDGRLVLTGPNPRINMLASRFDNVVEYSAAVSQTLALRVYATSTGVYQYNHLVLAGGGAKTLGDHTTVTGSLTRSGAAALQLGAGAGKKTLAYGAGAELIYAGTAPQTTGPELTSAAGGIGGLRVDNAAGVTLAAPAQVQNRLVLAGSLNTLTYTLSLGAGAQCAGSGDVLGTVLRPDPLAPGSYCFGNPNVLITLPPAATPPSAISVHLARGAAPFPGSVLLRYTTAAPGFAGVATLRLPYAADDLNGNDPARLHLWRSEGSSWIIQPATARGVDAVGKPYVESSSVGAFSEWTLADGGAPAAVTVRSLSASLAGGRAWLHWQTAGELDCAGFVIYRSRSPGEGGARVAELPAQAPGSPAGAAYAWQDPQPLEANGPLPLYYYRLAVVDLQGGTAPGLQPAILRLPAVYLPALSK